jgi:hypothetical protein
LVILGLLESRRGPRAPCAIVVDMYYAVVRKL